VHRLWNGRARRLAAGRGRSVKEAAPVKIALNLLYVEPGHLTGPGYYAVQLLEHMVDMLPATGPKSLLAYIRPSARHHFSEKVQPYLREISFEGGRVKRVLTEQLVLPFHSRRDGVTILFSPTFVSPMWGAKHLAVTVVDMYYRVTPELLDPFQRRYWSVMIPLSVRVCDLVLAISDSVAEDIVHYLPAARSKLLAIPLASRLPVPEQAAPALPPSDEVPFILMVANMTRNKNPEVVVRALSELRSRGRAIRMVHAGKDHLGLLAQAVEQHDAGDLVQSVGKISDDELIALYRGCLAAAVPSFYEGFGMPAVEAQSQGAPLLSSNRGSLPEAGGDAALYFDPEDHLTLAGHIEKLLDQPDFRTEVIARGYRSAARFSWEGTARKTLDALEKLLESRS
jgi:glycosyltransferase involved in cell wall biosynthesis